MRTTFLLTFQMVMICAITMSGFSQVNPGFKYQAVARDGQGDILRNTQLGLLVKVVGGSSVYYEESHLAETSDLGIFSVNIGHGNATTGDLSSTPWGMTDLFLEVSIDPNGGASYEFVGSSPILGVPFALYASKSESSENDFDTDPANELQFLTLDNNVLSISDGNSVNLIEFSDGDGDSMNEIQQLSKSGNIISLSDGGGTVTDDVNDADADPGNEIQMLSVQGNTLSISGGNSVDLDFSDGDGDPTNELQELTLNGTELGISDGNNIDLPLYWEFEEGDPIENIPDRIDADIIAKVPGLLVEGGTTIYSDGISTTDDIRTLGTGARIEMYNQNTSQLRALHGINSSDYGTSAWYGPNGNINAQVYRHGSSNNGKISVYDSQGNLQATMYVDDSGQGVIGGDIKNFRMDHPTQADKEIVYASLEGPEAGAYARGQVTIVDGEAEVIFPEHFKYVVGVEGMTIQLTPHSAESNGLAAIDRTSAGFRVKELFEGKGNYTVDWEAKSVRKGFEDYKVIRQKDEY